MALVLTSEEQRRMAAATRVLLTADDQPLDAWRGDVLRALSELLGGSMGGFILAAEEGAPFTLHNLPARFAHDYFTTFQGRDAGIETIAAIGGGIWNTRGLAAHTGLDVESGFFETDVYREFYGCYGIRDAIGLAIVRSAVPHPPGARVQSDPIEPLPVVLTCFHEVFGTPEFGERGIAMLRLLLPALEAGIATRIRLGWMKRLLHESLEAVGDGVRICDLDGRTLHANAALAKLLGEETEPHRLDAAMALARQDVASLVHRRRSETRAQDGRRAVSRASVEVRTAAARYQVSASLIEAPAFAVNPAVVISVQRLTRPLPSVDSLRARWALSPQEARVALLIARGASNSAIAAELDVKPTTARHYTEAVFLKLHVRSRAAAAHRVLAE